MVTALVKGGTELNRRWLESVNGIVYDEAREKGRPRPGRAWPLHSPLHFYLNLNRLSLKHVKQKSETEYVYMNIFVF